MRRGALTLTLIALTGGCYEHHRRAEPGEDAGPPERACPALTEYVFEVTVTSADGEGCPPVGTMVELPLDLGAVTPECEGTIGRAADGCAVELDVECFGIENYQHLAGRLEGDPPRGELTSETVFGIAGAMCRSQQRWVGR